ncbi:ATP-binding cassette domain-containing protein [Salinispirillum marinum]|uniref:ATP-binding protein Uup n=2 Tax=Saccharospirillaceae TaxID=255527 RepID=A0ABV8BE46_9GAMM
MPSLVLQNLYHAYGAEPVINDLNWNQTDAEKICLVGRNGEGKSTLMRLLAGVEQADQGTVGWSDDVRVGYVPQALPLADQTKVRNFIMAGAGEAADYILRYEEHLMADPTHPEVARLQHWIEEQDAWSLMNRIETILQRFELDGQATMSQLSGGWRRKALVARALMTDPNVLLLDEPTNHLDIDSIRWLEQWLKDFRGLVLFISHDRGFINAVADVIMELDRSNLYRYPTPYATFLEKRDERLEIEAEQNALFDKRLAQEEVWIRQGIKARRTRNEGRVRRLEALRQERSQRRNVGGKADLQVQAAERSGKLVFELKDVTFHYPNQPIVDQLSTEVQRGETIALVGANGIGKTTLIKLLLGQLDPTSGDIKRGTNLAVAYFDQGRHQLDPEKTVMDTVSEGRDFIEINGKKVHCITYLERFLFSPKRSRSPVKSLSGGEANRLLLARLFSQPANLLVLDEPTNDLDIDTLELLEELIVDFSGTVILISHDRYFVDNVATKVWGMPGNGRVIPIVGGYEEWNEFWRRQNSALSRPKRTDTSPAKTTETVNRKPKKLSYKDQREFDQLPDKIAALEEHISEVQSVISQADFYTGAQEQVQSTLAQLAELEAQLEKLLERWVELEEQT